MKKKAKKASVKGRGKGSAAKDLTAKKAASVKGGAPISLKSPDNS